MLKNASELLAGGVFLSDGGFGTELFKRGLAVGDSTARWNEIEPARVQEIHAAYADAGSDIVLANTFGANRIVLKGYGLELMADKLNRLGVQNARTAVAGRALVFGDMGPTGKMISMGDIDPEEAYKAFLEQAAAFKAAGADGVCVETMGDIDEFKLALDACKENGLFTVGCMSFDSGKDHDRTLMGATYAQMIEAAEEADIDMVGANCGVGIEEYVGIAQALLQGTKLPIWIKANAGLPVIENGKTVYKMGAETFAEHALALKKLGVRVIGGCCGTAPEHIRAVRKSIPR
ncbi:MAG: homocysteine S-methyltransferase family protein [Fibrobacterota bacterium]